MPEENTLKALQKYGGVFRWGSGLLGKSAIVVGPVVALILVGIWSLHSDWLKIGAMLLAVIVFFGWYFPFLRFCEKYPANALLEGVQWAEHQHVLMASKGQPVISAGPSQSIDLATMSDNPMSIGTEKKA